MELMRGLAFIALLFAGSAVGAELRQAEVCTDGTTHQAGYCPAVLSSASCSATGATTGSCSATSDETDGTRYVCATSSVTALTGAQIEACSGGAAIGGSSAAETGSNSVSLSGLTTDAAHYGQIVNESPEGWYSNRLVSSSFTPTGVSSTNQTRIQAAIASATGQSFALPSQVSGLQYPADPVTTVTDEIYTDAQLAAAVAAGNGRLLRIYGPGNGGQATYSQFTPPFSGWSDIDIVMDNDARIAGGVGWGWYGPVDRFRWTGGGYELNNTADADGFRFVDARDVLFDNVKMYKSTGGNAVHVFVPGFVEHTRFAVINSTIEHEVVSTTNAYSAFASATTASNSIWVNNLHIGVGPPVRFLNLQDNLIMVGNYYAYIGSSGAVRVHEETNGMWFGYNYVPRSASGPLIKFEISGEIADVEYVMNNVLIEYNNFFQNGSSVGVYQLGDTVAANQDQATNWVMQHNRVHSTDGPSGGEAIGTSGINISVSYTQTDDLRVGPGHADYITDPGPSGFGADH